MTIGNLKELEALIKLLRKQGVSECTIDGIQMKLGDVPLSKKVTESDEPAAPTKTYTDEEILLWSAGNV